jgi:hypothetical protein
MKKPMDAQLGQAFGSKHQHSNVRPTGAAIEIEVEVLTRFLTSIHSNKCTQEPRHRCAHKEVILANGSVFS